ncbi:MAG: prepilin-type N-terminal cleavage/methylation domain-containing protein [Deltaproteobacteria bacterium]
MSILNSQKGFTFTEIMIALSIMALGFLAMAQMQYLSLKQKSQAESGTVATNVIQFIADRDMEELKRTHLLNSIAFIEAQAGRLSPGSAAEPHLQHCTSGSSTRLCDACPCDPLTAVTSDLTDDGENCSNPETACAVINIHNFDPEDVDFSTNEADCNNPPGDSLIIVKQVCVQIINDPNSSTVTTLNVTYGVKSKNQFLETNFDSLSTKDTLATQNMVFSAHQEDWSQFIPGWTSVKVPHIP